VLVIVYFTVQEVVDPRDGHCLLYNTLYNTLICVSLWGALWKHSIPNNQIFLFLQPDLQSQCQYCILQNLDVPVITY
jgi:hypothetical protein